MRRAFRRGPVLAVLLVLSVSALTLDFLYNPMGLGEPGVFDKYQAGQDTSVRLTVERSLERGLFNACGLLYGDERMVYTTQPGLAGFLPSLLIRVVPVPVEMLMRGLAAVNAFLLAAALTLFAFAMGREFGWPIAAVVLALTAGSDSMVLIGRNTGWAFHLCLWPFVVPWYLYPRVLEGRMRRGVFLLVIGLLVLARAACGYEFITNVILGATVAPVYFGLKGRLSWRRIAGPVLAVAAAGAAGFALALLVNVAQTSCYYGSLGDGIRVIAEKAAARTIGPESQLGDLGRAGGDALPADVGTVEVLKMALGVRAMSIPFLGGEAAGPVQSFLFWFVLSVPLALVSLLGIGFLHEDPSQRRETAVLCGTLFWSMAGTLSWPLLAVGWSFHHTQLLGLAFHVTYMPVAFAAAAYACLRHTPNGKPAESAG